MKKNIIFLALTLIVLLLIALVVILISPQTNAEDSIKENSNLKQFNDCLAKQGVVIYGMKSCPHCRSLVELLGGYNSVENLYVDCTLERQKCASEMQGMGVPEIQINKQMYQGQRTLEAFSQRTGCPLPN